MFNSKLRRIRAQHEEARLLLETAQYRARQGLIDGSVRTIKESWGDLVQVPEQHGFDGTGFHVGGGHGAQLGDRDHGRMPPIINVESDLTTIRARMRLLLETSPTAIGVMGNLANFIMGTGFDYRAVVKKVRSSQPTALAASLVSAVDDIIDEFIDHNKWAGAMEREIFQRSKRDGEGIPTLWHTGGGQVTVRTAEPEQITEPAAPGVIEKWILDRRIGLWDGRPSDWRFGVHTDARDITNVFGYYVQWSDDAQDWDYLPASRVEHIKLNTDQTIKRGLSDFYPVHSTLTDAEKLLTNTARGAAVQAAIAFIREHAAGVEANEIKPMIAANAHAEVQTHTHGQGTKQTSVTEYAPGSTLDTGAGVTYKPGPHGAAHATNFIAIEQAVLRTAGTRWSMPEYMISADSSNANMASTMVAESPFVKMAVTEQAFYIAAYTSLLWKVVAIAHDAGRFAGFELSFAQIKRLVEIKIEAPRVAVRDAKEETERNALLFKFGRLSPETWSAREELDHEQEQAQGAVQQVISTDFGEQPIAPAGPGRRSGDGTPPPAANQPAASDGTGQAPDNVDATVSLNGAQITAVKDVLAGITAGTTATLVATELLVAVGLDRKRAAAMVQAAGQQTTPATTAGG